MSSEKENQILVGVKISKQMQRTTMQSVFAQAPAFYYAVRVCSSRSTMKSVSSNSARAVPSL